MKTLRSVFAARFSENIDHGFDIWCQNIGNDSNATYAFVVSWIVSQHNSLSRKNFVQTAQAFKDSAGLFDHKPSLMFFHSVEVAMPKMLTQPLR